MANPKMYYNTRGYTLQVGSYQVPPYGIFTYKWDNGTFTLGGSTINSTKGVSNGAMNTHLSAGNIALAFTGKTSYGLVPNEGGVSWNPDTGSVGFGAYIWGYKFKLKRPAQVFKGTTYQFTLPAEANVVVNGESLVGATFRQRLNIVGLQISESQHSRITGNFPTNVVWAKNYSLAGSGSWWIDTGAGNNGYASKNSISLRGFYIG